MMVRRTYCLKRKTSAPAIGAWDIGAYQGYLGRRSFIQVEQ
jgi:hypothetical protein